MKSVKTLLGIVIYEQAIGVADVESANGSFAVRRYAQYELPKGVTVENLSSESSDFKAFLKKNGFKSKKAIVGLSARHMISTSLKLPHIENAQVRHDTIKMNLERKMKVDFSEIVFDYDDQLAEQGDLLVLILLKKILVSVRELLKEAKILPLQVTSASLGLNLKTNPGVVCNVIEYPSSYELCLYKDGHLQVVHNISMESGQTLNADMAQKIVRQVSRVCLSLGISNSVHYCIRTTHSDSSVNSRQFEQLFGSYEFKANNSVVDAPLCVLAGDLAGHLLHDPTERINFLSARHDEQKPTFASKWLGKTIILAAGVLLLIGLFVYSWYSDQRLINTYQADLDFMKTDVEAAEKMINQVNYAGQWFRQEPEYLDMLRELTLSFPQNSDIWITSLAVDESKNQILTGRTVNEDAVLDVAESLRSRGVFGDIQILYIRKSGQGSDVMTFAINLEYRKGQ